MPNDQQKKYKAMLVSMVPPRNDCGGRIVMYRHLIERNPFELHVVSTADFASDLLIHTHLKLPFPVQKLKKSRFGPAFKKCLLDYENLIWSRFIDRRLQKSIDDFSPDVIITLAETGLCHMAAAAAEKNQVPLVGLFLDWCPIMPAHYGHNWTKSYLSSRFRELYSRCDLAFCTSDGMKEVLGPHPNSHVIYPMPGNPKIPSRQRSPQDNKFRLLYVGTAESFYGRMLVDLAMNLDDPDVELRIVGPNSDWPIETRNNLSQRGIYLGPMTPDNAAVELSNADAFLVVMSFESEFELFMRTSFTTKFLDYTAYGKPIILWGPNYCTPSLVAKREDGAIVVNDPKCEPVVNVVQSLIANPERYAHYARASALLRESIFSPDNLQSIFQDEILRLIRKE